GGQEIPLKHRTMAGAGVGSIARPVGAAPGHRRSAFEELVGWRGFSRANKYRTIRQQPERWRPFVDKGVRDALIVVRNRENAATPAPAPACVSLLKSRERGSLN